MDVRSKAKSVVDQIQRRLADTELSAGSLEERLSKEDGWWERVVAGDVALTLEDLFGCLEVLEIEPADFSAESYGLSGHGSDGTGALGRELAPGVYEEAVKRFFEQVAQRARKLEATRGRELDGSPAN